MLPELQTPKTIFPSRIALFAPADAGGGLERVWFQLAKALRARGFEVDFLCFCREEEHAFVWPAGVRVFTLGKAKKPLQKKLRQRLRKPLQRLQCRLLLLRADSRALPVLWRSGLLGRKQPGTIKILPSLVRYLETSRPVILLSGWPDCNLLACWAQRLTRVPTQVVVNECVAISPTIEATACKSRQPAYWRTLPVLLAGAYRHAAAVTAMSNGVADDLAQTAGIARGRIETIYNPIVDDELLSRAHESVSHPWLRPGSPPVILGAGRLHPQKDFPALLKAFARLRTRHRVRLMILGEGQERNCLEQLARDLGIKDDVAMPGWVANPYAYMAHATVFVLSSSFEGFGNVVAEALSCGCPVVSTDCPYGPSEILGGGQYGRLVPVGDPEALADAISATLEHPPDEDMLKARGAEFSVDRAVQGYLDIFRRISALGETG